jgi:hypothetical protein
MSATLALVAAALLAASIPAGRASSLSLEQMPPRGRPATRSGLQSGMDLRDTSCRHGRSPSPDPGDRYPSPTGKGSRWRFELSMESSASSDELPQASALRFSSSGKPHTSSVDI